MSLIRQSSYAAVAALLLTGSRFALSAIVARRLTEAGFGQFVYAQWLVDIAFLVCSLGATGAASRYMAEYRGNADRLDAFLLAWRPWALVLPLFAGLGVVLGAHLSGVELAPAAMLLLALWAVTSGLWAMQTAGLSGFQRFDLIFLANFLAALLMLAGAFWLPLENGNPAPLFGLMAAAAGLAALPGLSQTLKPRSNVTPPKLPTAELIVIRKYAMNMWLIALLWALVWSRGEVTIVRYYLGDAGVANYAAALTLFSGAVQGVMLGLAAVAPQLTRLWGEGRQDEAFRTARNVMDFQLLVCGMGASVLICLGPELLSLVFGANYREQSVTLATLSVGLIAMALANQNHLLQIATDGRFSRNSSIIGLLALVVLAATMAPVAGVEGVAFARLATVLLLAALSAYTFYRKWGSSGISIRNLVIVFGLMAGTAFALAQGGSKDFVVRCLVLPLNLTCLVLLVRNQEGQSTLLSLVRRVRG